MKWRSLAVLTLALVPLGTATAGATASLTCDAEDGNASISLLANIGRGDGASIQAVGGEIKLKARRGKVDAAEFKIEAGQISEHWSFGDELRIGIQPNDVNGVSVYLAIIAKKTGRGDTDRYRGRYVIKVNGPKGESTLEGRLKDCSAG
jgi:hypothetical protein